MSHKAQMAADVSAVFFCVDEFADIRLVNGQPMHVVDDTDSLVDWKDGQHTDGLYASDKLLRIPAGEYGPRPKVGAAVKIDGANVYRRGGYGRCWRLRVAPPPSKSMIEYQVNVDEQLAEIRKRLAGMEGKAENVLRKAIRNAGTSVRKTMLKAARESVCGGRQEAAWERRP